jgi:ectoine hydroxylase-related dioxygenase (phytanoyl-CoA dioxygenase family)
MVSPLTAELEAQGIVVLRDLLTQEQLRGMQKAFEVRLRRMRWNNFDGYEKTERYRHMVQDVLTLDQGFVDLALHPVVKEILNEYVGRRYELVEAKGWKSLPTNQDFHGWHGDAWYDQKQIRDIPREVKLGFYLTDVKSGAFNYIVASHRKQHPRGIRDSELQDVRPASIVEVAGSAGTAFLFDTSGIHRQGVPMLEERHAIFLNYHDPDVPLQQEDVDYYRYHPLILNAAFLGKLSEEDQRILGFGNKTNYFPAFDRDPRHTTLQALFRCTFTMKLDADSFRQRILGRLRRTWQRWAR